MKHIKLFEAFISENYEKYVMDKDYIPNLIKEKIKESFGYESPIIQQIDVSFDWEPIPFNELSDCRSKLRYNYSEAGWNVGPKISDVQWSNVCVAGLLRIIFEQFYTTKNGHHSDETAVINEKIDSALAKATKELKSKLELPPDSSLDNSGSHGPNCFVRDRKKGTELPPDSWYNQIMGIKPPNNRPNWGNNWYDRKIRFTTWLVLDKSYCEDNA